MKKVCHITSAHTRYDGRILRKQCVTLAKNGYDVSLIVNDNLEDEVIENVKIISTEFVPKNRLDRFVNSKKAIFKKTEQIGADIYQLHDPDLLPLIKNLKKTGAQVIFDSHENYPEQLSNKPYLPSFISRIIAKLYEKYEAGIIKHCTGVISVNEKIVERLKSINENVALLTNYPVAFNKEVDFENKERIVCFCGGVNPTYNHERILKAVSSVKNVKYELAGKATSEYLAKLKNTIGYENMNYHGQVSFERVQEIYNRSSVGLVIHYSKDIQPLQFGGIGCIKLFEFMEAGLAIICSDYPVWKRIIEDNECGIAVNPASIDEIKDAIEYLINNKEKAIEMGKNARRAFLHKYNWQSQAKTLVDFYNRLN